MSNPQDTDMLTSVNLDILRGEMKLRVDPPPPCPTLTQEDAVPLGRVAQLEKNLDTQMEEEEKWQELTQKLEKKTKQMADNVVRLDTSLKVFQMELTKRNQTVETAEEQLEAKQQEQQRVLDKMERDRQTQLDQAAKAQERAERAAEELEAKQEYNDVLTQRLKTARSGLLPLEERVQDLQINLTGNRGMSESQRIYYNAECQVEKDQRDRVLIQISTCQKELATLTNEMMTLKNKQGLFQDEHKRRLAKAKDLEGTIQETQDLFQGKLHKLEQEVGSIRQDRDAWEAKTNNLVQELQDKKVESVKLTVKVRLFTEQLQGVQATILKLKSMIEATRNMSVTSIAASDMEDLVSESEPEPEPVKEEDPYVWRPPQREEEEVPATPSFTMSKPKAPAPAPVPVVQKTVPKFVPPAVVKPAYTPVAPPVVKVHHVSVKMDPVKPMDYEYPVKPTAPMTAPDNLGLSSQLQSVQRDLEHQKRFQKEHAIKMEQQFARLASKVEVLANSNTSSAQLEQQNTESQLGALKHQIQKDAMRDAHEMRQLLTQLTQQCSQLSTKLEGLSQTVQQRDLETSKMERTLKEKETQYFEQMEFLRGEMERQLERQQQAFSDKMSAAMIQMEKLVTANGAANSLSAGGDSMASLESLVPLEGSSRGNTIRTADDNNAAAAAPPSGYSMVKSGITVSTSPWF